MGPGPVRPLLLSAALGLLLLGGAGGAAAFRHYGPTSPVTRGVAIDGRLVPQHDVAGWMEERRRAAGARVVRFRHEDRIFEATFADAGISLDADATLAEARKIGHQGSLLRRLNEAEHARNAEIDVPPIWTVDTTRARALIATYAAALYRAPVDARLDLARHSRTADVPGRELAIESSVIQLVTGSHEDGEVIDLRTQPVLAKVRMAELTAVNVEKVVSAWETTFTLWGTGAARAVNIRKAVSHLDGIVLAQGQTLSFNEVVGPRTRDRGFAMAPEIQGDEMQLGYGGGTCQASTTLYAAALYGALDIIERQSHSRPSHYAQLGLDATVSYPLADLKIRNSLPFPVILHAFLPSATTVRVEILGGDPVARVDYVYGVGNTEDFVRRIQVKENLAPGQRVLHQKGIVGLEVNSVVKIHYLDGREEERHYFSGYRPAPEIYWVAPGYDLELLPPLPERAKGVEAVEGVGG
jgi:vancomycin resistance protein YoaR